MLGLQQQAGQLDVADVGAVAPHGYIDEILVLLDVHQLDALLFGTLEFLGRLEAGLNLHGQVDVLGGGEQVDLTDLLKVHTNRVTGQHHRGGIDAAHARARTGRTHGALLLALGRTHLGVGLTGHLKLVIVE